MNTMGILGTSMQQLFRATLCGALFAAASLSVLAEKADKQKPMNLEADVAHYDDVAQVMIAEGSVVVTKGTMAIRAARLEQHEDPEGNQYLLATPKQKTTERVFFRQKREGLDEYMEGEAERIEYDGKADVLRLKGRAVMRRLRGSTLADESTGDLIVFNNITETMIINGESLAIKGPPQRVHMMLSPKEEKKPELKGGVLAPVLRATPEMTPQQ